MVVNFAPTCASPQRLKQVFHTIDAELSPVFQLSYAYCSLDGRFRPEELMQQAIAIGLKGLAITDHHTVGGYQIAQRWLENWKLSNPQLETAHLTSGVVLKSTLARHRSSHPDPAHPALRLISKKNKRLVATIIRQLM